MVVAGRIHIEALVQQVVDLRLFECELHQVDDAVIRHGVSSHLLTCTGPRRVLRGVGCQDKGGFSNPRAGLGDVVIVAAVPNPKWIVSTLKYLECG